MDLFGSLRALFSDPSFSTLAFSSNACPFPSAWAWGSRKNNQKLRAPTRLRHFPKIKLVMQTTRTWLLHLLGYWIFRWFPQINFFADKNPNNWLHWLVEPLFRQRIPKQCYQWLGKQNQQNLNKSNHPRLSATPRCSYPASPAHRPPGEGIWVHLQRDPRKWMIMMFSLKHAWTLGPGIYPGEPKHGASSGTRKPCKTGYIGGLQPPFVDAKMFQKQQF